ncbi:hypothetical protein, partial [Dyella sedimenti]|uniref:hypothetical protein n=1 Tax=Dyella sedimenti TaxID=2919947 RepID=UPI001FAAC6E8
AVACLLDHLLTESSGVLLAALNAGFGQRGKCVRRVSGFSRNKMVGAVIALMLGPSSLLLYDPPRSYLLACSALCFGWYEAFGLFPSVKRNASIPDIYRAFRATPARDNGVGSRVVGLLGVVLVIAAILVRT